MWTEGRVQRKRKVLSATAPRHANMKERTQYLLIRVELSIGLVRTGRETG